MTGNNNLESPVAIIAATPEGEMCWRPPSIGRPDKCIYADSNILELGIAACNTTGGSRSERGHRPTAIGSFGAILCKEKRDDEPATLIPPCGASGGASDAEEFITPVTRVWSMSP